jgi:hypothetical protein
MKYNKFFLSGILAVVLVFGFMGCDSGTNGGGKLTLTGYFKGAGGSGSVSQSISAYGLSARSLLFDETYTPGAYRSFPIDNQGRAVTERDITVAAILQFERDVPGYDDDPDGFDGYLAHYSSYPSNASSTGEEGVYLVFDSRDPSERYQVGYHHINLDIASSNLEYFEDLIARGDPISIFHVDAATLSSGKPTCWVVSWISESSGGTVGAGF